MVGKKVIKARKGFTLLETVVAFALFSVILSAVLSTTYTSFLLSKHVTDSTVKIMQARVAVDYMQRQFESAQRMGNASTGFPNLNQTNFRVDFKRSMETDSYWAYIAGTPSENGCNLKIGYVNSTQGDPSFTLLNISSYPNLDFFSSSNIHIASNNPSYEIEKIEGINDTTAQLWKMRMGFTLNDTFMDNKYFVFSAIREVSPHFERPTVVGQDSNNNYIFNIPLDTNKATNIFTYANENTISSGLNSDYSNITSVSSYLGNPAIIPSEIVGVSVTSNDDTQTITGTLRRAFTSTPISNSIVYAFDEFGHCYYGMADNNGLFQINMPSGVSLVDMTLFYVGSDDYAPCWASFP